MTLALNDLSDIGQLRWLLGWDWAQLIKNGNGIRREGESDGEKLRRSKKISALKGKV
jgi:hypothetical protein